MSRSDPQGALWHPRHWPSWIGFGALRLLTWLPYRHLMSIGRMIGLMFYRVAKRRAEIARINIRLCFPELDDGQVEQRIREHFKSTGMGIMDFAIAWWWPEERIDALFSVEGSEHVESAFSRSKGVIFFTAHFSSIEVSGRLLSRYANALPMYRPNENPVIQKMLVKNRELHVERVIPREDVRLMIRTLKANKGVWFAPDQNYGLKNSEFCDFFGIPAATNTSTSRFAGLTGAAVVPFVVLRRPEGGFHMIIEQTLDDFPTDDPKADTQRLNDIIERWARLAPEQYNWMHRRFKDRPGNETRFY